ncbi:unnamed protein product [Fraxinus pennsylvanica]|uniref:Uncharacterized protein n=1 Tax=Fraxinus pennsylvanica TaxID=56036 RepID=A0AAD1YM80_9LAMI|nr:unnamed protein product [Fraxinus pennsylvanica]
MDRKFNRNLSNEGRGSISLQKKIADSRHSSQNEQIPDLTDFMNDMFFGSVNTDKKTYNLTGTGSFVVDRNDQEFESSARSVSSRLTQEWLEEAKQMMASSPSRDCDSPSRLVVSPRFATTPCRLSTSTIDKRRSRHTHSNRSESNLDPPQAKAESPQVQKRFINMIKIPTSPSSNPSLSISPDPTPPSPTSPLGAPPLPLRQSMNRKSRFQTDPSSQLTQPIPTPTNLPSISKRRFKNTSTATNNAPTTILDTELLSPPKHVKESAHRRTISSSTCSVAEMDLLSPPGNLVEWAQRRSLSSSTCRIDRNLQKNNLDDRQLMDKDLKVQDLNVFLKEQRIKIGKILSGEIRRKAKIVLSGPSNS